MKRFISLLSTICIGVFPLITNSQSTLKLPKSIKNNLHLAPSEDLTLDKLNEAFLSIRDSVDGEVNKDFVNPKDG